MMAELLPRIIPILSALGIDCDWRLLHAPSEFFTVSKAYHHAQQSKPQELNHGEKDLYSRVNEQSAKLLETSYDVFVVHDPQPAALRAFAKPRDAK